MKCEVAYYVEVLENDGSWGPLTGALASEKIAKNWIDKNARTEFKCRIITLKQRGGRRGIKANIISVSNRME